MSSGASPTGAGICSVGLRAPAKVREPAYFFGPVESSPATVQRRPFSLSQVNYSLTSMCFPLEADCALFHVLLHSHSARLKHLLNSMDDTYLQRAMSCIPSHSILLIEDIDCSFENRDNEDKEDGPGDGPGSLRGSPEGERRSSITLSGFLNAIDGVGSKEGRLFFATVSAKEYINALNQNIAPRRLTTIIDYELSTAAQAVALFMCFFQKFERSSIPASSAQPTLPSEKSIAALADAFAKAIPAKEFSTADLQGYLQLHKTSPHEAAGGAGAWVEQVHAERRARAEREAERRRRVEERYAKKVHPEEISSSRLFSWVALVKKVSLVWLLVL